MSFLVYLTKGVKSIIYAWSFNKHLFYARGINVSLLRKGKKNYGNVEIIKMLGVIRFFYRL